MYTLLPFWYKASNAKFGPKNKQKSQPTWGANVVFEGHDNHDILIFFFPSYHFNFDSSHQVVSLHTHFCIVHNTCSFLRYNTIAIDGDDYQNLTKNTSTLFPFSLVWPSVMRFICVISIIVSIGKVCIGWMLLILAITSNM